jgi:hypothetical protein
MIQGSDQLDISSCDTMKPISGVRRRHVHVSGPQPRLRCLSKTRCEANSTGSRTQSHEPRRHLREGPGGRARHGPGSLPAAFLQQYLTDPDLQDNLRINDADRTWYLYLNLLAPPFDDLHVRKAASLVVDKAAMLQAAGGESSGQVATMPEPPSVLPETGTVDPYPSPNHAGDVAAAQEEMKQSKYDSDGDGKCDADVCNNVVVVNRNTPWTEYTPILQQNRRDRDQTSKIRSSRSAPPTTGKTIENIDPDRRHGRLGQGTTAARSGSTSSSSTRRASRAWVTRTTDSSG